MYDLKDPRRGPLYAIRECAWYNGYLLELGIFYYDHPAAGIAYVTQMVILGAMICDDGDVWLQLYGESSVLSGMDDHFILYLQAMKIKFTLYPVIITSTSRLPPSGALK